MYFNHNSSILHKSSDSLVSHVKVCEDVGEEEEGPGRLGDGEQVDDCVEDASPGKQSVRLLLRERTQLATLAHLKQNRAVL